MARMRQYATNADRQAAYRARMRQANLPPLYLPALAPLSTLPSTGRWRAAVDLCGRLLQVLAEEMQAYADQRSERWQESEAGDLFLERLDQVSELQGQVDDLRSSL